MNGEIPSVPITTLAGIASLTECEYATYYFLSCMNVIANDYLQSNLANQMYRMCHSGTLIAISGRANTKTRVFGCE